MVLSRFVLTLLLSLIVTACQVIEVKQQSKTETVNPEAATIQGKLFEAADKGDIRAFESLLSKRSVALFEQHFEVMAGLERPADESAYGWEHLLNLFAQLPPSARARTPFDLVQEDGRPKLDLATHPDASFFSQIGRAFRAGQ